MAVSTALTTLKYSTDAGLTYEKLVDITNYPDLGATPTKLDTTDLSATNFKTSILGLQDVPDLTFEANYDKDKYDMIEGLTGTQQLQLEFGLDGANGMFNWDGEIRVYAVGGAVDEVRKMMVVLSSETPLVFTAGA